MRRLIMASLTAVGLIGAGLLSAPQAQAMPAAGGLALKADSLVQKVALVCPSAYWNGFAWVKPPCYQTYPRVVAPIVAPVPFFAPPVVVVRKPYRPRRVVVY